MGNAAAGSLEQDPSEKREARNSVGTASGMGDSTLTPQKRQPPPPKLPMPPEEELQERFNVVLVSQTGAKRPKTSGDSTHSSDRLEGRLFSVYVDFLKT